MALDKRIKEKINSIMEGTPNITAEELVNIVREYAPRPDVQKLIEQEYRRIAQRIIASYKDEHGVRDCFSVKAEGHRQYVNISHTQDKEDLQRVRQQLSKKYRGLNRSLKKIDTREQILDGQIEIEEVVDDLKEKAF